jgi:hypothetical protein
VERSATIIAGSIFVPNFDPKILPARTEPW